METVNKHTTLRKPKGPVELHRDPAKVTVTALLGSSFVHVAELIAATTSSSSPWFYSSWRTLAASHILLHSRLSITFVLHLFTPILIISSSTSSNHLFLGLSSFLQDFLPIPFFVPFDCSLYVRGPTILIFTFLLLSRSWYIHLSSCLLPILHIFLSFTGPKNFPYNFLFPCTD
jgi:hypothetical protein